MFLGATAQEVILGIFFNFIVGKISKECGISESEISKTISCVDGNIPRVDNVSFSRAVKNYRIATSWEQKQKAIWQIYYHYKIKGLGL